MIKALVVDVQGSMASVLLDDSEIIDVEVESPVSIGDDVLLSDSQIMVARSQGESIEDMYESERPTFDW